MPDLLPVPQTLFTCPRANYHLIQRAQIFIKRETKKKCQLLVWSCARPPPTETLHFDSAEPQGHTNCPEISVWGSVRWKLGHWGLYTEQKSHTSVSRPHTYSNYRLNACYAKLRERYARVAQAITLLLSIRPLFYCAVLSAFLRYWPQDTVSVTLSFALYLSISRSLSWLESLMPCDSLLVILIYGMLMQAPSVPLEKKCILLQDSSLFLFLCF